MAGIAVMGQQLTSVAAVFVLKFINTGDRVLDSAVQVFCTSVISAVVGFLVALMTDFDGTRAKCRKWGEFWGRRSSTTSTDPLQFRPETVPAAVADKPFAHRAQVPCVIAFASWFHLHHGEKHYVTQTLQKAVTVLSAEVRAAIFDKAVVSAHVSSDPLAAFPHGDFFPVWVSAHVVYVHTEDGRMPFFYSNDYATLQAAIAHVAAHDAKMCRLQHGPETPQLMMYTWNTNYGVLDGMGSGLNSSKTFDRLFFRQKRTLLRVLTSFKGNSMFPPRLGMENKLGILLQGAPGTGKTAVVAAIANFLNRCPVLVDIQSVRTKHALNHLFSRDRKKYLFVFEEFDCASCVGTRRGSPGDSSLIAFLREERQKVLSSMSETAEARTEPGAKDKDDALNLGYLLQKLDGCVLWRPPTIRNALTLLCCVLGDLACTSP
jgi:hypothetical protein